LLFLLPANPSTKSVSTKFDLCPGSDRRGLLLGLLPRHT
jgi:hypothetical protein